MNLAIKILAKLEKEIAKYHYYRLSGKFLIVWTIIIILSNLFLKMNTKFLNLTNPYFIQLYLEYN